MVIPYRTLFGTGKVSNFRLHRNFSLFARKACNHRKVSYRNMRRGNISKTSKFAIHVLFIVCSYFTRRSSGCCNKRSRFSMRQKVRGFYGSWQRRTVPLHMPLLLFLWNVHDDGVVIGTQDKWMDTKSVWRHSSAANSVLGRCYTCEGADTYWTASFSCYFWPSPWRPPSVMRCIWGHACAMFMWWVEKMRSIIIYSWSCKIPPITYSWTVPLILDHSYLVGKLTSSKIADTKVSGF
jgi:hypothetical protein